MITILVGKEWYISYRMSGSTYLRFFLVLTRLTQAKNNIGNDGMKYILDSKNISKISKLNVGNYVYYIGNYVYYIGIKYL